MIVLTKERQCFCEFCRSQFSRFVDEQNRIWKPEEVSSYRNLFAGHQVNKTVQTADNYPPWMIFLYAIEANNAFESIFLKVTFRNNSLQSAYFVFYFWQLPPFPGANETRKFAVFIDGQEKKNLSLGRDDFEVVSGYPVTVTGSANVTIKPVEGSTLPPLLSAMEVFTAINETDTSKSDKMMNCSSLFIVLLYSAAAILGFM